MEKNRFFFHDVHLSLYIPHFLLFAHGFMSFNIDSIDPVIEMLEYLPWKRYIQKGEIDLVVYFYYALYSATLSENHGGY